MVSLRRGSRKEICPKCGHRTFTPYVDEEGVIIDELVGRCDREQKCRYHYTPKEYYESNRGLIKPIKRIRIAPKKPAVRPPMATIPHKLMMKTLGFNPLNNLHLFVHSIDAVAWEWDMVVSVCKLMRVGSSKMFGGSAVFWLIDRNGVVRDGKIMGYDPLTGKRVKHPRPQISNAHTAMNLEGEFRPCMFGEHLLAHFDAKMPILLFESEKAALIMALAMSYYNRWVGIPMATGGCGAFNPKGDFDSDPYHRLAGLKDRDVVLFPDKGLYHDWHQKAYTMWSRGFIRNFAVSDIIERKLEFNKMQSIDFCAEEGECLDDIIIELMKDKLRPVNITRNCINNPYLNMMSIFDHIVDLSRAF